MSFARSSRDLLRLVGGLILLLVGLALATIFSDALLGFEIDLVRVVRGLPEGLAVIVFGTIRALSILAGPRPAGTASSSRSSAARSAAATCSSASTAGCASAAWATRWSRRP